MLPHVLGRQRYAYVRPDEMHDVRCLPLRPNGLHWCVRTPLPLNRTIEGRSMDITHYQGVKLGAEPRTPADRDLVGKRRWRGHP